MSGSAESAAQAKSPWNYFLRIPTYVILFTIPQRYGQTDGRTGRQTDRQTT